MKVKIWPYKMGSKSARLLARTLGSLRLHTASRTYRPRRTHVILNWGNSQEATWYEEALFRGVKLLNHPEAVSVAANKLKTFRAFTENNVPHPAWTTSKDEAIQMIEDGHKVYCRQQLTGRSGSGIIVSETPEQLVPAPLYTKGVKVKDEYRVHIFNGEVIDYVQKRKLSRESREARGVTVNPDIRNHSGGWIFAREGIVLPDLVRCAATNAVDSLALDFGAVDVCTDVEDNVFVFEVNSAPGIEGTTLQKYVAAVRRLGF
jgi:hypothetical protein